MAVFRVNKTKDFTVLANRHFREQQMSLKAKGLLSLMLSLPDEWDYSIKGLTALSKDGKASVGEGLKELENFGYLIRHKSTEDGKFSGVVYDIYEVPHTDFQKTENQDTENQDTENQDTENRSQINTNVSIPKPSNTYGSSTQKIYFDDPALNEAFLSFIADRKERGKKMTTRAIDMAVKKIDELSAGDSSLAIQIINQSIANGWSGLFPYKAAGQQQQESEQSLYNKWRQAAGEEQI